MQANIPDEVALLGRNALVNQYLSWLKSQQHNDGSSDDAPKNVQVVFEASRREEPFLSVIMRTQGKRMEELVEALHSLQCQVNRDFELIVVGHNVDVDRVPVIEAALNGLEGWLRERCTFLLAEGGTRSRPLNVALSFVRGRYFSVFDEDDLVYDNWVASFGELSRSNPDHIIYCFVETQSWHAQEEADGTRKLFPLEEGKGRVYCQHPNEVELISGNRCPVMGLAFPSKLIDAFGLRFDERLQTTEDWHFFMRARNVFPFISSDRHVALYRLWSGTGGYSTRDVDQSRWDRDAQLVIDTFENMPWVFGKTPQLVREESLVANRMDMYLDAGEGFGVKHRATPVIESDHPGAFVFTKLEEFGPVSAFRIDPQPHGPLALADFSIEVRLADGAEFTVEPSETVTNGRVVSGQYEFPGDDPQIVVSLPSATVIDRVVFKFEKAPGFVEPTGDPAVEQSKPRSLFRRRK